MHHEFMYLCMYRVQSYAFPDEDEKALLLRPDAGPSSSKPPSPTPRCQPPPPISAFSTADATAAAAAAATTHTTGARSEAAAAVWQQAAAEAAGTMDPLSRPLAGGAAVPGMPEPSSRPLAAAGGSLMDAASEMTEFMSLPRPAAAIVEPISFPPTEEGYASKVWVYEGGSTGS